MADPEPGALVSAQHALWHRLLHALYDGLFLIFLAVTSPYFLWRMTRDAGMRASIKGRFGGGPDRSGKGPAVLVHGVSVGEIKTARSLVDGLLERRPDLEVVVSSTTPAGFALASSLFQRHLVIQFPLDLSFVVRRVLRRIRPCGILLMELEVWPNLLAQANSAGVPVMVVNGRISRRSFRGYRSIRGLLPELEQVSLFAVQTEEYADRLRSLGIPDSQIEVTGNMKYDNLPVEADAAQLQGLRQELGIDGSAPLLVAGSTHPGEEEMLLGMLSALEAVSPGLRLVIALRHIERSADVVRVVERAGRRAQTLTEVRQDGARPASESVLVLDTIGELESFYSLATLVFVGGSLILRGGHNILEPASLGKPVLFGPHMDNFRQEARVLLEGGGAVQVADAKGLERELCRLLGNPREGVALGLRGRQAVARVRGATDRNLDLVLSRLHDGARSGV